MRGAAAASRCCSSRHAAASRSDEACALTPCGRQLLNPVVPDFKPCCAPPHTAIDGRHCTLVPVDCDSIKLHGAQLYSKYCEEGDKTWTYLPYGAFACSDAYLAWLLALAERREGLTNDAIP